MHEYIVSETRFKNDEALIRVDLPLGVCNLETSEARFHSLVISRMENYLEPNNGKLKGGVIEATTATVLFHEGWLFDRAEYVLGYEDAELAETVWLSDEAIRLEDEES